MIIEDKYGFPFKDYKDIDASDEALEKKLDELKNAESKEDKQLFKWLHSLYITRKCYKQQPELLKIADKHEAILADIVHVMAEGLDDDMQTTKTYHSTIYTDYEIGCITLEEIENKVHAESGIDLTDRGFAIAIIENPTNGYVYNCGNYKNGEWRIIGTTCGYV